MYIIIWQGVKTTEFTNLKLAEIDIDRGLDRHLDCMVIYFGEKVAN